MSDLPPDLWAKKLVEQFERPTIFASLIVSEPPTLRQRIEWRILCLAGRIRDAWLVLIGRKDVQ